MMTVLLTLLMTAVILVNGWTDAPNAIATCVSTRSLSPRAALLMAGRETGLGAVVNILDSVILGSAATERPYFASKRELAAFTRSAAATFAATLRVNGIAPGPVLAPTEVHVKAGELLLDHRPTPDDVAAAVSYLLSAESTTGAIIPVDSGQYLIV